MTCAAILGTKMNAHFADRGGPAGLPPGAAGLLAAPFFEIPTATHWGDMLAHRVHPSDLSALSDHGETCRVPEATLARVPTRTPHIATLGTGSFLRLGLGHQEDRWKVTP